MKITAPISAPVQPLLLDQPHLSLSPLLSRPYYQDKFENHHNHGRLNTITVQLPQSVFAGAKVANSISGIDVGPGFWGQGVTLAHQQAALGQISLKEGAKGPFINTSTDDPTQDAVTVIQGGHKTHQTDVNVSAGANIGNVESRLYNLFYSGISQEGKADFTAPNVGIGVGGGGGLQVRADAADESASATLQVGSTRIGGKKITDLVNANVGEEASIGNQFDAEGMLYAGHQGIGIGGGMDAFSGAQIGGTASANVDGVGASMLAQGWAGEGFKADFGASLKHGDLTLSIGLGAALDLGGYIKIQPSINFAQIAHEIQGIGDDSKNLSHTWGKKAGVVGSMAGAVLGAGQGVGKLALKTAGTLADLPIDAVKGTVKHL